MTDTPPKTPATIPPDTFGSIWQACVHPRAFFGDGHKPKRLAPLVVFAFGAALPLGATFVLSTSTPRLDLRVLPLMVVLGFVFAIPGFYLTAGVTHLFVRLFLGRRSFAVTAEVLGYASAPNIIAVVPVLGLLGVIWGWTIAARGLAEAHGFRLWRAVAAWLSPLVASVLVALGLRTFVVEAFKNPSGSMFPTLEIQDHLFVAKSAYGVLDYRLPARGDVIVFEYPDPNPAHPRQDFIKRVIALPGEVLTVEDGQPHIDGWPIPRCRLGEATVTMPPLGEASTRPDVFAAEYFVEFLGEHVYVVALEKDSFRPGTEGPYTVLEGEVYVLGENRNNSSDSRVWRHGRGAGVPLRNIKGSVWRLWLPVERLGVSFDGPPVLPASLSSLQGALTDCLAHAPALQDRTPPRAK